MGQKEGREETGCHLITLLEEQRYLHTRPSLEGTFSPFPGTALASSHAWPRGPGCRGPQLPGVLCLHPAPLPKVTCTLIQEVGQEASHDSLVADDEHIALPLQLHDDRFQPLYQVLV